MDTAFEKLLLSEMRIVVYKKPDPDKIVSDESLLLAMTVNEELKSLGYILKPEDLTELAKSSSLSMFPEHFRSLIPEVNAKPMYPDFPKQVMELSEAEFRMHQMLHYFSTYGVEQLFGAEVSKGWLPDVKETEKTETDDLLLESKVLELICEEEAPFAALTRTLRKRERLTLPGRELVSFAVPLLEPEILADLQVPFKENLIYLFDAILLKAPSDKRISYWSRICQHTGDVIKCINGILPNHKFHFTTSQKKALVRLLESYPDKDFRANLILSRTKREKSLKVLQYLDYNMFSRSSAHKESVRALRNGELRSWEAQAKYLLSTGDEGALDFIAARPGMMIRMVSWLLRKGYSEETLLNKLEPMAGDLSLHTIVDIINGMDQLENSKSDVEKYAKLLETAQRRYQNKRTRIVNKYSPLQIKKKYDVKRKNIGYSYIREKNKISKSNHFLITKILEQRALRSKYLNTISDLNQQEQKAYDPEREDRELRNLERKSRLELDKIRKERDSKIKHYDRALPYADRVRHIMFTLLSAHLERAETELYGKKVFLDTHAYDISCSRVEAGNKSSEGGYLPSGIAIRIPEAIKHLRFFVYWDDKSKMVDLDLHAFAHSLNGNDVHIGWDADYNNEGILHSGDITHSNAAEYIDIDMDAEINDVNVDIDLYYGKNSFKAIQTCYVGMMGVSQLGEKVKLYNPANCFFTHELRSSDIYIRYGFVDVQNRLLYFLGKSSFYDYKSLPDEAPYTKQNPSLSLEAFLQILLQNQKSVLVSDPDQADIILTIGKSADERAIDLIDRNFYLEA